jgi:hypothetical protein
MRNIITLQKVLGDDARGLEKELDSWELARTADVHVQQMLTPKICPTCKTIHCTRQRTLT